MQKVSFTQRHFDRTWLFLSNVFSPNHWGQIPSWLSHILWEKDEKDKLEIYTVPILIYQEFQIMLIKYDHKNWIWSWILLEILKVAPESQIAWLKHSVYAGSMNLQIFESSYVAYCMHSQCLYNVNGFFSDIKNTKILRIQKFQITGKEDVGPWFCLVEVW